MWCITGQNCGCSPVWNSRVIQQLGWWCTRRAVQAAHHWTGMACDGREGGALAEQGWVMGSPRCNDKGVLGFRNAVHGRRCACIPVLEQQGFLRVSLYCAACTVTDSFKKEKKYTWRQRAVRFIRETRIPVKMYAIERTGKPEWLQDMH